MHRRYRLKALTVRYGHKCDSPEGTWKWALKNVCILFLITVSSANNVDNSERRLVRRTSVIAMKLPTQWRSLIDEFHCSRKAKDSMNNDMGNPQCNHRFILDCQVKWLLAVKRKYLFNHFPSLSENIKFIRCNSINRWHENESFLIKFLFVDGMLDRSSHLDHIAVWSLNHTVMSLFRHGPIEKDALCFYNGDQLISPGKQFLSSDK